jgi:2-methylisocitrate lyase-like PEP mutase family enzyme
MKMARHSIADKRRSFQELHRQGCFVIPNPWDLGSARYLESLGFKALASTSSGFAWSQAHADGDMSRNQVLAHLQSLVAGTDVPVNADFQSGFGRDAAGVAESVALAIDTGIAGLSIEDSTGDPEKPLFDVATAVQRIRGARHAIDSAGGDVMLVGRSEGYLVGQPDLEATIARLKAYAAAGADCLYAPGMRSREDITAVVAAVAPKPVNVLIGSAVAMTVQDLELLGVRRVSVGGALARCAWGALTRAAQLLAERGSFEGFAAAASGADLDELFGR